MTHNVEQAGYDRVRIVGDAGNDIVDVCRLTCLEQGIKIVSLAGSELPPTRHSSLLTHHCLNPTNPMNSTNPCPILHINGRELSLKWPEGTSE